MPPKVHKSSYLDSLTKRSLDISVAIVVILMLFPFLPIIAVLIKVTSPGSVLYARERLGINGIPFKMLKFRTMRSTSGQYKIQLRTQKDDPRITWLGKFLRRTYIDELPQFWNVLMGDMSISGPRPEFPELEERLEKLDSNFKQRLSVKPGITGMAQLMYPHAHNDLEALGRLKYDIQYITSATFLDDLQIMLRTVKRVFLLRGV